MALTKTQISELYVALLGRASEGEGNKFWQTYGGEGTTTTKVAQVMLALPQVKEYFGDSIKTDKAFIEHIYLNTFGKTPTDDEAGIKFWIDFLAKGKTRAEAVAAIVYAATRPENAGKGQETFKNKVAVSNYTADKIEKADNSNLDKFKKFIANVTDSSTTVDAAKSTIDADAANQVIPSKLKALSDATTAQSDWLKTLPALDKDLDGTKDVDAGKATAADVATYHTNATSAIATSASDATFATRGAAAQDAIVADAIQKQQKAVSDKAGVLKDGEKSLVDAVASAKNLVDKNFKATKTATDELTAEKAKFESLNTGKTLAEAPNTTANNIFIKDGKFMEYVNGTDDKVIATKTDGSWTITEAGKAYKDVLPTISALEAKVAAAKALAASKESLQKVVASAMLKENNAEQLTNGTNDTTEFVGSGKVIDYTGDKAEVDFSKTVKMQTKEEVATKEVQKLKITNQATANGNVTVDGKEIAVTTADDTPQKVAAKIAAASFDNWTAKLDTDGQTVILTAKTAGNKAPVTINNAATGVTNDAVVEATNGIDGTAKAAPLANAYLGEVNKLDKITKESKAFQESRTYKNKIDELKKAIDTATKAITNATDDKKEPGLGLNKLDMAASVDATSKNDVMLLATLDKSVSNVNITNFGTSGLDRLYVGNDYKFVKLSEKQKISDNLGDINKKEIFYKTEGGNTTFWVEKQTFAGNGSTTGDMTTITLTGVTDVTISDGFISAGTPA